MILSFNIEYRTNWGEEVTLSGLSATSIPMHTTDGIYWTAEVELDIPHEGKTIQYNYQIEQNGRVTRKEWNHFPRTLFLTGSSRKKYKINDSWKNIPEQEFFYSSAFTEALLKRTDHEATAQGYKKGLLIKAYAPRIHPDYSLAICGNQKILGNWDPQKAILMDDHHFPEWQVELDASKINYPLEYKFVLWNKVKKEVDCWEANPNRYLAAQDVQTNETRVISDRYVHFDIPAWKGAGVAIPVFSLRSEKSYGVGDFGDLKRMVDWAASTHQKMIQILPINDTTMTHTWTDSYPYNSISIYAFHPMYADLEQMGTLKDHATAEKFRQKQKELNQLTAVDYEAVNETKWEYFRLIFKQEGEKVLASDGFQDFFKANSEWLKPYAVFSYLRDAYRTADFRKWPKYTSYHAAEIDALCKPGTSDYPHIALYYFIQYHLHLQLQDASRYARQKGIALKGDIPIGISRNSVEAWTEPHYFNLNGQAGAPPDDFSDNGQNWGFPTYNWEVMEKDGYRWWMKRFQKMAEYFDAYRIDHILGFFRIWEIPMHSVHGLLGQFSPSLPMSREEIESYGLKFKEEYLQPYIHESFLGQLFGPYTHLIKQNYIEPTDEEGHYRMKPGFETQQKVKAFFTEKKDDSSSWIQEGLYTLISNVLFIADKNDPAHYHPRIGVQKDFVFRSLTHEEQEAFNRLYDQYYYHRHNDFWQQQAMKKLPQLTQSTRMLVCGEDLGMIPGCVPAVMNELQILSLEIQRMPKQPGYEFGHLHEYPYSSVCTISTHDMSTLRGWWEENYPQTQRYFNSMLGHYGTAPVSATPEVCEEVVRKHLQSNSLLCVLSFQDWLSIDGKWRNPDIQEERINVPSNPRNYWKYRMHLTLEQLMNASSLNNRIRSMIEDSGRNPAQ